MLENSTISDNSACFDVIQDLTEDNVWWAKYSWKLGKSSDAPIQERRMFWYLMAKALVKSTPHDPMTIELKKKIDQSVYKFLHDVHKDNK